ncbi:MAG TPA: family 78 glycoside hydrolase catalytic domain, partial [Armatimonadota bacterium]|nr:family 78 glycoside hydrolase catalytic domain [Armatimonadota bacterium]
KEGANTLAIEASNAEAGPAGLAGRLVVEYESGPNLVVDIDRGWKVSDRAAPGWQGAEFNAAGWQAAQELGPLGIAPWGVTRVALVPPRTPSPHLRKEFTLEKPVRRARLYATALGAYQAFLNGRRVGDEILAPGWTDYRKRVQYQTYDVTPLVSRGRNALGAILGDGWFAGSLGFDLSRFHFGPGPVRLRMQLNVEYADGTQETVGTDGSWRGRTGPILESDIYAGETYDARLALPGWDRPGYSDSSWRAAAVLTDRDPELNAQVGPPIRITQEVPTRQVTQPKPGVYVFDLGQNMVGWARLKARGPAGTKVTMRFAEVLNPDGTVYRDNLRLARATDTYILAGNGAETFEPHFTYHGFRYVEVTGLPGAAAPEMITGRVFHSAMPETSRLTTSSQLVNRLYQNILWGQRGNLMSVPTDCPQRDERLGWMGDAQIYVRAATYHADVASFYNKWLREVEEAQLPSGA